MIWFTQLPVPMEAMMEEKCPKCGAGKCSCDYCQDEGRNDPLVAYLCGSEVTKEGEWYHSWACEQIAALTVERDQLREKLEPETEPLVCLACCGVPCEHICPPTLSKPAKYSYCFVSDDVGGYTAYVREFPGCLTEAGSLNHAHAKLTKVAKSWIAAAQELGQAIPEPCGKAWEGENMVTVRRVLWEKLTQVLRENRSQFMESEWEIIKVALDLKEKP